MAVGCEIFTVRVIKQVASLQLLCQRCVQKHLADEKTVLTLPLPTKLKAVVTELFCPTIKVSRFILTFSLFSLTLSVFILTFSLVSLTLSYFSLTLSYFSLTLFLFRLTLSSFSLRLFLFSLTLSLFSLTLSVFS